MVVAKDKEGGSQREPGIYGRTRETWRSILKGNLLQDHRKGFWLKQLKLSLKDEMYHTLLVADGRLSLVNLYSDSATPGSILTLGTQETPLIEVLTGQKRLLPAVKSVDDISFYASESNLDFLPFQLLVVSVKCDSCSGNGITFALAIKPMTGERKTYELVGKPWVLDYRYYSQLSLHDLIVLNDKNRHEINLRSQVATDFIQNTNLEVFRDHKQIVTEQLDAMLQRNGFRGLPPVEVDLASGQLAGNFNPSQIFTREGQNFRFVQHYDMRAQIGKLLIQNNEMETRPMLLDFRAPGEPAIFGDQDDPNATIFSADGKLYMASKLYQINITDLGPSPAAAKKDFDIFQHVVALDKDAQTGVARKVIFLSTKYADGTGSVEAIRLAYYSTGAIMVEDRTTIFTGGLTHEQLVARIQESEKRILFDSQTPMTQTPEEYKQIIDRSKPLINVGETKNGNVVYAFGEPLHKVESSAGFEYREYAPSPLIKNPTGIYGQATSTHKANPPSLGQVLSRESREAGEIINEIPVLSEIATVKSESMGPVSVKVVAQDPVNQDGKRAFKLLAILSSHERKFPSLFAEIAVGIPFKDLRSVRVFAGRKNHDKNIAVVITYERDDQNGQRHGFTSVINLAVTAERGQIPKIAINGQELLLAKELLESSAIADRIVYDEEGRLHFVMTPNVPREERRFEMLNIFERRQFKPAVEKGIKLLWDQKAGDDSTHFEERKIPWRLPANDIEKRFPFIPKRTKDAEAGYLWGKLFDILDTMAKQKTSDKIKILRVPDSMKRYVNEVIITRYGRKAKDRDGNPFNWANRSLRVYQVDGELATQDDFLDNLDSIQRQENNNNVIITDMETMLNIDRPTAKASNFHIKVLDDEDSGDQEFGQETQGDDNVELPHSLYLFAAGEPLQPEELRQKPTRKYSTLIVSTPEEWEVAKEEAASEMEVGLDERFEVIDFPLPTPEDQARLLAEIFEDKNVKILKYSFDAKGIARNVPTSAEGQMTKVLEYAVIRVASEAENAKMDGLNAFVTFRNLFANQLLKDRTARRGGVIDKAFVERCLTSVFDIPVNLESLPPDDPIYILSRKDAVRQLQEKGVAGPFALKARVIKTMLSILKSDPTRSIPSSHIFIGESGSGKTRMVSGILDWLFPNKYDFNNPGRNYEANSIRINVGKMVENRKEGRIGEQLTFDDVKEHINNFLVHGFRGAIFLDDFHAAPESVRVQLLGFVRTLMETQGLYNAHSTDYDETVPVPLRHLHLFINLNPTENQAQIDAFRKNKQGPATFEEILLASLSTKEMKVERSFLKRIGAIHNLMQFPHGAKAPALSGDSLITARDIMLRKQKLVINNAGSIRAVADNFPDMDARTFLSTASSSLVDQVDPQLYQGNMFQVVPGRRHMTRFPGSIGTGPNEDNSDKGKIENFVERSTKILPLNDKNPESQLQFIRTLSRNYRLPVFEQFAIGLEDDPRFSESIDNQRNFLLPSMMAVRDHLMHNSITGATRSDANEIPLMDLNLDPAELGLKTSGDKALFKELVAQISPPAVKHFPFPISKSEGADNWDILITAKNPGKQNNRTAVITRYFHKVEEIIKKHAKKFYVLETLEGMPNAEQWVRKLPQMSVDTPLKPSIEELRQVYWEFLRDINDPALRDPADPKDTYLTPYTSARLFYFLMDKSIAELPWIQLNKHIIRALDNIVQDQVLGQSPAVKSYFFDYKYSPIRAANPELIVQLVESSQLSVEYPAESQSNVRRDYQDHCERLMGGK